jgi:VWFA-related protein
MSGVARALVLVLGLLLMALPPTAMGQGRPESDTLRATVLRIDASQPPRRDVYLGVSDSRGRPITGLDRSAFGLSEDGQQVPIEQVTVANDSRQPIAFGLLVDVSGSMNEGGKLDGAKRAAHALVASLGPADTAAIVSFADRANVVQEFTSDHAALDAAIDSLEAGGDTALFDALERGVLLAQVLPQPRRVILLVTDGDDTRSAARLDSVLGEIANARGLTYAVGLGDTVNRGVLDRIAQAGPGRSIYSDDPADLETIFQSILDQMRLAYVLRYTAPGQAGGNHTVAADVEHQGQAAQNSTAFALAPAPVAADVGGVIPGEVVTGGRQIQAVLRSGAAQRMDLLVDGQVVASSSGQPTTLAGSLPPQEPGAHNVSVRVTDSLGAITENQVPITVPERPSPTPMAEPAPTEEVAGVVTRPTTADNTWLWLFVLGLALLGLLVAAIANWRRSRVRGVAGATATGAAPDDATIEVDDLDGVANGPVSGPRLLISRGGQEHEVPLNDDTFSIGRDADNNLVLRDAHVSRHHALISRHQGAYWIEDLKSQNGTLQDGRVRIERKQLVPGDRYAIGDTVLSLALPETATPVPAPADRAAALAT